jgi:hypothetical protein
MSIQLSVMFCLQPSLGLCTKASTQGFQYLSTEADACLKVLPLLQQG